ncbi:hypothetical protein [Delftia acidovorans]|uniref:hypothetical protein n=1 Tax=Delftia acidovorans TaxID=80866 RepID=UPI00192C7763|nr:hypothetical protein [Delftia acidovorans]
MLSEDILFKRINNAVLDLQGADYQSLPRPYRMLVQALDAEEFRPITKALTAKVDLDDFLAKSEQSNVGMYGSARLAWPDDNEQYLGLCLLLLRKYRDQPDQLLSFSHAYFNAKTYTQSLRKLVSNLILPFIRDFRDHVETHMKRPNAAIESTSSTKSPMTPSINIHNFQGILGDVSGSTVQQTLHMGLSAKDLDGLLEYLRTQGVAAAELCELRSAIESDPEPTSNAVYGSKVSAWIGKMLGLSASGAWGVGLAAAGNILSAAISTYYGLAS